MARALTAGPAPRRRAMFGLLDADGWGWASVKAFFWFIVIIFLLAYVPDRAYYFTVSRTIDLGILAWSPVNLCPPENEGLPCPVPAGSILPWHPSPPELALPAVRTDAAFVQAGTNLMLIGGSDGESATDTVFVARTVGTGNFDRWQEGPPLPEPRADAGVTTLNGVIYVVGGYDEGGSPTDTVFVLAPDLATGNLGEWQTGDQLDPPLVLPEARAAAPLVALADGLLLAGGAGPDGQPTRTSWKSTIDENGALGEWQPQGELVEPSADAVGVLNGEHVWLLGGRDANGPTNRVQRATIAAAGEPVEGDPDPGGADSGVDGEEGEGGAVGEGDEPGDPPGAGSPTPGQPDGETTTAAIQWAVNPAADLPAARTNASGFAANGTMYLVGGSDGSGSQNELYWTVPTPGGDGDNITEWKRLAAIDLPEPGLEGAAINQSGPDLFLVGGVSNGQPLAGSARASTAPQEPFFQLGLVGAVVPALQIGGEIGQQLGYLNAAGAGGTFFALLVAIGVIMAHRDQSRAMWSRFRARRRR